MRSGRCGWRWGCRPWPMPDLSNHPRDGSCSHWTPLWGYCRSPHTRRYLIGDRCRLDAPGATAEHCAHRVPWGQECQACLDIWSTEGTVKAST